MNKGRMEAFSDGVIAIIITIMVLEIKVPHDPSWSALMQLWPVILSYILSFIYVGIYWNNHHHLLHTVRSVDGSILWANMHLLFWLSLVPFTTGWMGENHFASVPTFAYGVTLLMSAVAYYVLSRRIICHHGEQSTLGKAVGRDNKGLISLALYASALPLALWQSYFALALYATVALMWLIPDRRIESTLKSDAQH